MLKLSAVVRAVSTGDPSAGDDERGFDQRCATRGPVVAHRRTKAAAAIPW